MPGASAVAVRESRSPRNGSAGKRQKAKRSSSSAAALSRSRSPGGTAPSTGDDVVATGYTQFNSDLPPIDAPIKPSKVKGHHDKVNKKTRPKSILVPSSSSSSSDRQVRFLQDHNGSENSRQSPSPLGSSSASSSGVSSASSSPPVEKSRPSKTRSVSMNHLHRPRHYHRRLSPEPEGRASSANSSSTSLSPGISELSLNEDDVTCAICLDLLHRPCSLPCGHTFCLICLQNYASCRTIITCPSCRGVAQVPKEGVVGLPPNELLAEMVQAIKERRLDKGKHICGMCDATTDVLECSHCKGMFCRGCGTPHLKQVQTEIEQLRQLLVAARDTFSCRVEEEETRFRRLEQTIEEVVEDRVAKLHEEGRKLQAQVHDMRKDSQKRSDSLSQDIDRVLGSCSSQCEEEQQVEWEKLNQLHASLKRLLKATSNAKGPRVTLDEVTLSLSASSFPAVEDAETKEDDEDDRPLTSQDHSLHYRIKGTLSRMRWGQHLGERPAGVAVNPNNNDIFVTGSDTCRIFVYDSNGRQIGSFGSRGHSDGQFLCPIGLAFSHVSNEVLITDKWKHCIHVFDTEGNFIRQLGRKGKGYGHFTSPEGIATDRHGRIYVADTCNHRVQVLDSDGVFLREVGVVTSETLGDGQRYTKSEFNEPTGVAASLDGSKVYVADAGNHRIKVFNGLTGQRELMFGSRGKHKGQFESPESIVVDAEGFMLIGDSGNGRVQVFRPNGNFVRFLGSRGNSHGEFGWVSGVALSKSFDVVVTDFKNNLVAVF